MATSSILGAERATPRAKGRDNDALGPSDSTDSGSDLAGIEDLDSGDPAMPVDAAMNGDFERPDTSHESIGPGIDADAAGTGERRSAAGDGGREAADIAPDRIEGGLSDGDEELDDLELDDATDGAADDALEPDPDEG